jgi:GNAT superfamily N-acetyltransferase
LPTIDLEALGFRKDPRPSDAELIHRIVSSSGFFSPAEIDIALELLNERITKGESSGYYFLFAEAGDKVIGYACFGPIPCTESSFDLYWIAVQPDLRGSGAGRRILAKAEAEIRRMGGTRIYVETSSRELYRPTRAFYSKCGYAEEAALKDFYAPGDDKIEFLKILH